MIAICHHIDAALIKAHCTGCWHLGIINHDFHASDHWIKATAIAGKSCITTCAPGYTNEEVRLAMADDISAAPDYVRTWLQEQLYRNEMRLLQQRGLAVYASSHKVTDALRNDDIKWLSDLERFTDVMPIAMEGIHQKLVNQCGHLAESKQQRTRCRDEPQRSRPQQSARASNDGRIE